jgi:hypothetical protein
MLGIGAAAATVLTGVLVYVLGQFADKLILDLI